MENEQFIAKIRNLKNIKPREEWVLLTKEKVFSDTLVRPEKKESVFVLLNEIATGLRIILGHKLAFSTLTMILVLVGVFGFAQKSLPGDFLYPVKKITEQTETILVSPSDQTKRNLEIAKRRLDDLTKVAQINSVKNLAPAINEAQASVYKVAKELKTVEPDRKIVKEVKEIEKKTTEIKSLGIELGVDQELDAVLIQKIKDELDVLTAENLSQEEIEILKEVKEKIEEGNYAEAWEKILTIEK